MDIEIDEGEPELEKCNEITKPTALDISKTESKLGSEAENILICETKPITNPLSETELQVNLQRFDEEEITAHDGLKKSTPEKSKRTPTKQASSK
ncbi:hypothetical protein JTB14_000845 [Gonioctena quinquepunctata]|nr:hypothetical protein JTB14_000845 [Gonioctena quinquepunctata]